MTPERDKQLCETYPKIFADRGKNMQESCMFWGLAVGDGWYDIIDMLCRVIQNHIDWSVKQHDISVKHNELVTAARAGDLTLFNTFYKHVEEPHKTNLLERTVTITEDDGKNNYGQGLHKIEPPVPQVVADQVKEKFAGLRFYYHGGDDFCDGVVAMAEAMSERTCEECGVPGTVGGRGWIKTLCVEHRQKLDEERYGYEK